MLSSNSNKPFEIEDFETLKSKALHYAKSGETDNLNQLLSNHLQLISIHDWVGDNLLSISCWHGHFATALMLIENYDLDVNHRNFQNATPLHRACSQDNTAIAQMLINKGANTSLTDDGGKKCVDCGDENTKEVLTEKIRILRDVSAQFRHILEEENKSWDIQSSKGSPRERHNNNNSSSINISGNSSSNNNRNHNNNDSNTNNGNSNNNINNNYSSNNNYSYNHTSSSNISNNNNNNNNDTHTTTNNNNTHTTTTNNNNNSPR